MSAKRSQLTLAVVALCLALTGCATRAPDDDQQLIEQLGFLRLAKGDFVGLGCRLSLRGGRCPAYFLAGQADDIAPTGQEFAAERLRGTPKSAVKKGPVPGKHVGLFRDEGTLRERWPEIARWVLREQRGA